MKLPLFLRSVFIILAFFCTQMPATQIQAQEVQVAFDAESDSSTDARIYSINRDLRNQLGLFLEYPGFEQATLFRLAPGRYSLEISSTEDGRTSRITSSLDSTQLAALRADIRSRVTVEQPTALVDQSGRAHFLWTTAGMAFLYYGPAFAVNVGGNESASTGSYLLGGGLGFLLPYVITANSRMTDGMAAGARVGATLGIAHTALAFGVADAFDNDEDLSTFLGVSSIVSAAELTAGTLLAGKYNVEAGRANLIGVGGVFGTSLGIVASVMVLGENTFDGGSPAILTGAGLVGSLGGMYYANEVALRTNYTTGDAKAVMMGGLTGGLVSLALVSQLAGVEVGDVGSRLLVGMQAAGIFGGCYAAHKWLGRRNFTDGDGNLVILGTTVGGLIGVGISAMIGDEPGTEFLLPPAIVAAAGFTLMMATLGKGTEDRGMLGTDDYQRYGDAGIIDQQRNSTLLQRMEFSFNPLALGMAAANIDVNQNAYQRANSLSIAGMSVKL